MTERIRKLYLDMIGFDAGRPDLIQHFTKVHAYARLIGEGEGLGPHALEVLEAAALVHDIAIPLCEEKYGSGAGHLQEREGPALVREIMDGLDFTEAEIERAAVLVGEHHTYQPIDGIDHQILVEADFIVNSFENGLSREAKLRTLEKIFRTNTGRTVYAAMFGLRTDDGGAV